MKIHSLPAAATRFGFALLLTLFCSCRAFKPTNTWNRVTQSNIPGLGDVTQNETYAKALQRLLTSAGVENKLITFRYPYYYGLEKRMITRSVVIYRNEATPEDPLWLMDNLRSAPMWLPSGTLEEQLCFAAHVPAVEIVSINGKPAQSVADSGEPVETDWEKLFRRTHGTPYDPQSAVDRKKMAELKKSHQG